MTKNILFPYRCDIFRAEIMKKDFEETTEKTLKYSQLPCCITDDTNARFTFENFQTETEKRVKISLPTTYRVSVGDEIFCEGENFRVEDVSRRIFASGRTGSLLLKCQKIYE